MSAPVANPWAKGTTTEYPTNVEPKKSSKSEKTQKKVPAPSSDSAFTRATGIDLKNVQIVICVDTSHEMKDKEKFDGIKQTRMEYVAQKVAPLYAELLAADPDGIDTLLFDDDVRQQRVHGPNEVKNMFELVQVSKDNPNIAGVIQKAWELHEKQYCMNNSDHKLTVAVIITAGETKSGSFFKSGKKQLEETILKTASKVADMGTQFRIVFAPVAADKKAANFISGLDNLRSARKDIVSQINIEQDLNRENILNKAWAG